MRYSVIARDAGIEVLFHACEQIVEGAVFSHDVPVECACMFDPNILPIGIDTKTFQSAMSAFVVFGFMEARARSNKDERYVPFDSLMLSESIARLIALIRDMEDTNASGKILRAFQRLRGCGHVAHDVSRKSVAA